MDTSHSSLSILQNSLLGPDDKMKLLKCSNNDFHHILASLEKYEQSSIQNFMTHSTDHFLLPLSIIKTLTNLKIKREQSEENQEEEGHKNLIKQLDLL